MPTHKSLVVLFLLSLFSCKFIIFYLFACLLIFYWMPDSVYEYVSYNIGLWCYLYPERICFFFLQAVSFDSNYLNPVWDWVDFEVQLSYVHGLFYFCFIFTTSFSEVSMESLGFLTGPLSWQALKSKFHFQPWETLTTLLSFPASILI